MRDCTCHSHNGFRLSPEGLAQRKPESFELASMAAKRYLDKVGSVSGLELERDSYRYTSDIFLDRQAERFHNGT